MTGMLTWKRPGAGSREKAVTVREQSVLHVRFLKVEVLRGDHTPESVLRRRVRRALKWLKKQEVCRVVLPESFEYDALLDQQGLVPVSTVPLRQLIAADWAGWKLKRQGTSPAVARVAVSAAQITGEVVRTVTELALRHRYVLLDLPRGGEDLCRQMRKEYGVSLLLAPSEAQLREADVWVQFAPREREGVPGALPLYDESVPLPPLSLPPVLEEKLPNEVHRGQLLAVLREAGVLRPGQLAVNGTNLGETPPFLTKTPP